MEVEKNGEEGLRVVIVGYGYSGKNIHHYLLKRCRLFKVYGILVRNPKIKSTLSESDLDFLGADTKIFTDIQELLSPNNEHRINLAVISTPTPSHYSLIEQFLTAKIPVVCDKPVVTSSLQLSQLLSLAQSSNTLLTVFQNRRLDSDFLTVQNQIFPSAPNSNVQSHMNSIGQILTLYSSWWKPGLSSKLWKENSPISSGSGRFWDIGTHLVDQILVLFSGRVIKNVQASLQFNGPLAENGGDTHTVITIDFDDKSRAVVDICCTAGVEKERFVVVGTEGTFVKRGFDYQEDVLKRKGDLEQEEEKEELWGVRRNGKGEETRVRTEKGRWLEYYDNVGRVLREWKREREYSENSEKLFVKVEEVLRQLRVLEAVLEYVQKNKAQNLSL